MSDTRLGMVVVILAEGKAWPAWVTFKSSVAGPIDRVVDVTRAPGLSDSDRQKLFELAQQCIGETSIVNVNEGIDLRSLVSQFEVETALGYFGGLTAATRRAPIAVYRANLALGGMVQEALWRAAAR